KPHEVHGAIRDKWVALGSERSPLGYPLSDETPRPEAGGRYNNFQFGFISWTAPTGAHAVYDDYKAYLDRLENTDRGSACEQRGPRHSWHAQAAITVFWYRLKWELSPTSTEL